MGGSMDLTGKFLVAMPGMGDMRFEKSVVFVCAHSADGAMGLIVNKPTPELNYRDLFRQLDIDMDDDARPIRIHFGGPVEHGRGFVLHSGDYVSNSSTLHVCDRFGMTATLDVLQEIGRGEGPDRAILALGYAGWGPYQVEGELQENGWLVTDADPDIVFGADDGTKWAAALKTLGVDPLTLSAAAGRA